MKVVVWLMVAALVVVHQIDWCGEDVVLFGGFLPSPLAYHMSISLAAACTWLLAARFAWPADPDEVRAIIAESESSPDLLTER